jgi:S-(hydroxymethyl)glutathione dehydrogenase / alcohol dehydrogenase
MKAAVMLAAKEQLVIHELEVGEPQAGEVLVKTGASGICHSDLHFIEGLWPIPVPAVLGHESAGTVEKVGEGVTGVKPGDRVVLSFVASCGKCHRCIQGRPVLCTSSRALGRPGRLKMGDQNVAQMSGMGAFAEYQLVAANACIPVPDDVPIEVACLVGCSVMTGVGAVTNTARIEAGSTVAVIGCGGIGLNVIQGAVLAGASRIIGVDISEAKLGAAKEFGATDIVDASEGDPVQKVVQMTAGGVDYAFEAIGIPKTTEQAFNMARRGGKAVVVGMLPIASTITLPGAAFLGEKGIIGSYYGSARQSYDMPWVMELYRQKRLKIDELITRRYKLEQINEGFEALKNGEVNRSVIIFD